MPTATKLIDQADEIYTDITNFDGLLSGSDTDVQAALETIDEITKGETFTGDIILDDGSGDSPIFKLVGGTNDDSFELKLSDSASVGQSDITLNLPGYNSGCYFIWYGGTTALHAFRGDGYVDFNYQGRNVDFQIRGDTKTALFYADAGLGGRGAIGLGKQPTDDTNFVEIYSGADGKIMKLFGSNDDGLRLTLYSHDVDLEAAIYAYDENDGGSGAYKTLRLGHGITDDYSVLINGSNGYTGIGKIPTTQLNVYGNKANDQIVSIQNDGNDSNRYGMESRSGRDDATGTNYAYSIRDGNGDTQGYIRFTSGTVTYEPFTGSHSGCVPEEADERGYPYGTVMVSIKTFKHKLSKMYRQVIYETEPSKKKYDKRVFGIYADKLAEDHADEYIDQDDTPRNLHGFYVIGDGHIRVCNQGGNIRVGDYLTTSDTIGHAMKQNDDVLHNYTVAKATQAIDWDETFRSKKIISCTYHSA